MGLRLLLKEKQRRDSNPQLFGLRYRNSSFGTLSQNGYGDIQSTKPLGRNGRARGNETRRGESLVTWTGLVELHGIHHALLRMQMGHPNQAGLSARLFARKREHPGS